MTKLEETVTKHLGEDTLKGWKEAEETWEREIVKVEKTPEMANPYKFQLEEVIGN